MQKHEAGSAGMRTSQSTETEISIAQVLFSPLRGLWEMIIAPGRQAARIDQVRILQSLGDEQLAERGMTRATMLQHLYAGPLYNGPIRRETVAEDPLRDGMTAG
ncbi:hypothetical protein R3X27_20360 [Tropicimonas sp. TH_r6]|uniref:hypothetical protein n=1 Tax=Tropicimonas sp. TH_r6 TaxID=3082085 RepID=UPI0029531B59|nr:hypothetical protein [Tropicimonas sp. TH_r6]MDV7145040.1 hypothetical protein [Tropicimonas sp. TH_r6]